MPSASPRQLIQSTLLNIRVLAIQKLITHRPLMLFKGNIFSKIYKHRAHKLRSFFLTSKKLLHLDFYELKI